MMIKVFDTRLRTWRALTNAHRVNEPSWSHDSRFIYYDTEATAPALRRVRIEDGTVENLIDLANYPLATQWSGLTPGDSPMVLHFNGTQNLYALKLGTR